MAFWLSRGYTGKYRIFSKPTCESFCCNPKHLMIKGLREIPQCKAIKDIKLHHENILQYHIYSTSVCPPNELLLF